VHQRLPHKQWQTLRQRHLKRRMRKVPNWLQNTKHNETFITLLISLHTSLRKIQFPLKITTKANVTNTYSICVVHGQCNASSTSKIKHSVVHGWPTIVRCKTNFQFSISRNNKVSCSILHTQRWMTQCITIKHSTSKQEQHQCYQHVKKQMLIVEYTDLTSDN